MLVWSFKCSSVSHSVVSNSVTPWTVAHQSPLPVEFPRQEYWSGQPFPSPGDLPDQGIEPRSPALQTDPLPSKPPENHVNTGVLISFWINIFVAFSYILSSRIAGWRSSFIFNFLKNFHTVFHSGYTNLQSHQQYKCSLLSTAFATFVISYLFDDSHSDSVRWYLSVVLIYVSLVIDNVENLFMYQLAIYTSSFETCQFGSSLNF